MTSVAMTTMNIAIGHNAEMTFIVDSDDLNFMGSLKTRGTPSAAAAQRLQQSLLSVETDDGDLLSVTTTTTTITSTWKKRESDSGHG